MMKVSQMIQQLICSQFCIVWLMSFKPDFHIQLSSRVEYLYIAIVE